MTTTTIPRTTTRSTRGRRSEAGHPTGIAARLDQWSADRRRRRFLVEQRRWTNRDRSDRYLDHPDETHQRQALAAFVQR
jgi:hypothetical protein